jgi:uncharacterized protein (DUF2141 family)
MRTTESTRAGTPPMNAWARGRRRLRFALLPLAWLLVAETSVADAPPTAVLNVRVSQLRSSTGQVGCTIYNSARGFPTDPSAALEALWCPVANGAATCSFGPLPAGTYAVACFHDENGNGKLDTGLFGIPKESIVVSNRAKGFLSPPSFDKAKFSFAGVPSQIELRRGD